MITLQGVSFECCYPIRTTGHIIIAALYTGSVSVFMTLSPMSLHNKQVKNETYKENLMKLEQFVMVMFLQDTMVQPKESEVGVWLGGSLGCSWVSLGCLCVSLGCLCVSLGCLCVSLECLCVSLGCLCGVTRVLVGVTRVVVCVTRVLVCH